MQHGKEGASHHLARDRVLTSQMNVKRSVELALLGRNLRDEPYATVPRVSTPSKEKNDVSVKMDFGSVASRTAMTDRLCEG